jgi:hypothetical protein
MKHSFLALATLAYCFASDASAATPPGRFEATFHNAKSKLCMGVAQGDTKFGAYVKQGKCRDSADDQSWIVEPAGPKGFHVIKNRENQTLCLGVDHGSDDPGADVRLFPCDNKPNQRWKFEQLGKHYRIKNRSSDPRNQLCLGVDDGSTARAQLKQGKCSSATDQQWNVSTGRTPSHAEDGDKLDNAFDTSHRNQLLHDLEAYKSKVHSNTKLLKHDIRESLDVVMSYDRVITQVARSLHIRKAIIQSEVFWEYWKENAAEDLPDGAVLAWYGYKLAYEAWLKVPLSPAPTPPVPAIDDSSTGIAQIKARTAIRARNWAVDHHVIKDHRINAGDWHWMYRVWKRLHDDGTYNISTVPLVVLEGASRVGVRGVRTNYSSQELKKMFATYNGRGDAAREYGAELYGVYEIFDHYNAMSR